MGNKSAMEKFIKMKCGKKLYEYYDQATEIKDTISNHMWYERIIGNIGNQKFKWG